MKRFFRRIFYVLLLTFLIARLYFYVTDDFRLSNIQYDMPYQRDWEVALPTVAQEKQLHAILSQQFAYVGKGAQAYVFASDDDRYVIKFFKFKHLRPSWFHAVLPSIGWLRDFKEKQAARKQRKLYSVFNGYKVAYDVHQEESGLLFIQLNVEGAPHRRITVRDKLGLQRIVDLSDIPFIIQTKGVTLRNVLSLLLNDNDVSAAEECIGKIFDLYASEYRKGIYDHDHGVMYNTGFIGNRPIHLDVGKMVKEETMRDKDVAHKDLLLISNNIKEWVRKNYPQHLPRLSGYIDGKMAS